MPAAGQWLQWGGPARDFRVEVAGIADTWPVEGPPKLWQRPLGDGYSAVLCDGHVLYTMCRRGSDEFSVALDARTGETIWEHGQPSPPPGPGAEFGGGPHATPLVVGGRLFTVGTNAVLHCFDKRAGRVLWEHDLVAKFGAAVPGYGYACSPLAYGDTLILSLSFGAIDTAGGATRLIALDQATGRTLWEGPRMTRAFSNQAEYSSPLLIKFDGEDQVVFFTNEQVGGFNPATGALLWTCNHPSRSGVNVATPVWNGTDLLFCSSAYDAGARAIRLTRQGPLTGAEELWFTRKLRLHHGNAVLLGDTVYASSGDFGPAFFTAINLRTGEIAWRERGFRKANSIAADGKLIILDEDGTLALATATQEGLTVHARCHVAERIAWTAPTLVGHTLYIRDRRNIMALDLGRAASGETPAGAGI